MEKKDKIYTEAKLLFYNKGFNATTLKDIGEAADVNTALISYYFKNKTNLAVKINDEYLSSAKILTRYFINKICPDADLYLQTAVDIRVTSRNYSSSPELLRFYLELNETNFYTRTRLTSAGFFENLNRHYRLGFDRNYLRACAISNYALANALSTTRANGFLSCSDDFIVESIVTHHGTCLGLPDERTQEVLDASVKIADQIDIKIGSGFKLIHHKDK